MDSDFGNYLYDNDVSIRWNEYIDRLDERVSEVNSMMIYNQFVNEEVRRLNRNINFQNDEISNLKSKYNKTKNDYDDLLVKFNKIKDKYESKNCKNLDAELDKKRKADNRWYNSEKRKRPRNYKFLSDEQYSRQIENVFKNIKCLNDIIELKNEQNKYDFFPNSKFEKLYKLIPTLEELNNIIGMNDVKESIFKHICFFMHGLESKNELNHIVITGDPGVGKTTLARILGKIYLSLGFLTKSKFVLARRSDLIGEYCGHTAVKTQKVIDSAIGGILFIDEVYSLGNPEKRDTFTKECIDTINQNLTENGDKFLCIIAGYKDDVKKCFFNYNQGLERRFPIRYNISKYKSKELLKIFQKFLIDEGWQFDQEEKLLKLIEDNYEFLKFQAGDLRTILKKAKEEYSVRLMNQLTSLGSDDKKFEYNDILKPFKDIKEEREIKMSESLKFLYT